MGTGRMGGEAVGMVGTPGTWLTGGNVADGATGGLGLPEGCGGGGLLAAGMVKPMPLGKHCLYHLQDGDRPCEYGQRRVYQSENQLLSSKLVFAPALERNQLHASCKASMMCKSSTTSSGRHSTPTCSNGQHSSSSCRWWT